MWQTKLIPANRKGFQRIRWRTIENLGILTEGDLENFGERGSDILVEMDDIVAPTFVYGDEGEGGGGGGAR